MNQSIVQSATGMTLIGAAPVKRKQIDMALKVAPFLVAADGGADTAVLAGHVPDVIIGDMDSVSANVLASVPAENRRQLTEQDTTDFEKSLYSIKAPFVIALGVMSGRLDHTLAALNVLVRYRKFPVIAVNDVDMCFAVPTRFRIELPVKTRLSLFPFAPVQGSANGLLWPLDDVAFAPFGKIGTSNETTLPKVEMELSNRNMLAVLPVAHLQAVITALVA